MTKEPTNLYSLWERQVKAVKAKNLTDPHIEHFIVLGGKAFEVKTITLGLFRRWLKTYHPDLVKPFDLSDSKEKIIEIASLTAVRLDTPTYGDEAFWIQ